MGRQWLLAKREVNAKKKSAATSKLVKEIAVAAKLGGPDPDGNPGFSPPLKRRARTASRATSFNAPSTRGQALAMRKW
jgi:transcriptional/translational regulatory protein YebC/TACO1